MIYRPSTGNEERKKFEKIKLNRLKNVGRFLSIVDFDTYCTMRDRFHQVIP